jgi:hypothetical protein
MKIHKVLAKSILIGVAGFRAGNGSKRGRANSRVTKDQLNLWNKIEWKVYASH